MDPEPAHVAGGPASPPSDPHQISSDPEPDADDWDEDARRDSGAATPTKASAGAGAADAGLELDGVDWNAINDEVEAAMNESDDDDDDDNDGKSEKSEKLGNASEDEGSWTDETNSMIRCAQRFILPPCEFSTLSHLTAAHIQHQGGNGNDCAALRRQMVVGARMGTAMFFARRWRSARRSLQIGLGSPS